MTKETGSTQFDLVVDDFYRLFNVSKPLENDTCRPHPRFSQYRHVTDNEHDTVKRLQNQRRNDLLNNLKRKREKLLEKVRPLIELIDDVEGEETSEMTTESMPAIQDHNATDSSVDSHDSAMEVCSQSSSSSKRSRRSNNRWKSRCKDYRKLISKQLMLSEWLVDVPEDFYTNWYLKCCPRGKRTLVIASNGSTRVYSRTGYFMFQFESLLPGGSRLPSLHSIMTKSTLLDCIYVEQEHKFYILDVITWNGVSFYDCETEFRFYWLLTSSLAALETTTTPSIDHEDASMIIDLTDNNDDHNKAGHHTSVLSHSICKLYSFAPLQHYDCTVDNIKRYANGPYEFNTQIDGILFYHKQAPYTPGITPLVCWLKPPMISNILNISLE